MINLKPLLDACDNGAPGYTIYLRELTDSDRYIVSIHNNIIPTEPIKHLTLAAASTILSLRQHIDFDTLGYWVNDNNELYVEAGRLYESYQDAYEAAVLYKQVAIYDILNEEVIEV